MRKSTGNLCEVKELIQSLKGQTIKMEVNKGRNKKVKLIGIIDQVYPSMFVIKTDESIYLERLSFSYSDVLCGDIKFLQEA